MSGRARSERIQVRVSEAEASAIAMVAQQAGKSVAQFIRDAALATARQEVDRTTREERRVTSARPVPAAKARKANLEEAVGRFRTPFVHRRYAVSFEQAIREAASGMQTSELSSVRHLTFFFEAVGQLVANGEIVRIPGVGAFGPYYSERARGIEGCLPRFVASPAFRDHVQWNCPAELNRNRELLALRRRRRSRRSSIVDAMRTLRLHVSAQNRYAQDSFERWIELGL